MANKPSKLDSLSGLPTGIQRQYAPQPFVEGSEVSESGAVVRKRMTKEQIAAVYGVELIEPSTVEPKEIYRPMPEGKAKYRDPEKRKSYMRELMRKKRAKAREDGQ